MGAIQAQIMRQLPTGLTSRGLATQRHHMAQDHTGTTPRQERPDTPLGMLWAVPLACASISTTSSDVQSSSHLDPHGPFRHLLHCAHRYLYAETSGGSTGKRFTMTYNDGASGAQKCTGSTPVVAYVDFAYHMYGSTMGTLRLMDNSNDQVLWSKTGGSGFSYYAYWKYATNVPAGTTQIRFEYLRGGSYTGDACFTLVKITCGSRITTPKPPAPLPPPSAPLGCLPDTCFYKFDGVCDDGGEGAEYSSCAGGTDCYDCGPRLSPPPSYPPVPPLPAVNSFPLIVPLLEMKLIMIMPPGDPSTPATGTWASLLQDPIFALNFQNGLQSLFNCREPPYCETEIKATNQVDLSWQVACNRTINVTATSGDAPVDTGANSSNWCDRNGTELTIWATWGHAEVVELCPPSAPNPPPSPPFPPPPPPPPSPWYDKVNGGMNPKTMEDNFVRAQLRLYKMSPPSPPPPPPPGCSSRNQLVAITQNATRDARALAANKTIEELEDLLFGESAAYPAQSLHMVTLASGVESYTSRVITMPPSAPPPPPVPSAPPPPPDPPAPPAPPPALCSDTCNDSGQGTPNECDDGAANNGRPQTCEVGTDCSDCGLRSYCFSCPQECHDEAVAFGNADQSCLEYMWLQDGCYSQCNTAACGHHHCTDEAAIQNCLRIERISGEDFITSPAESPEVGIHPFKFGQLKLLVEGDKSNSVLADFVLKYTLTWNDPRLLTSACRAVLDKMLSSKGSEESPYLEKYWRPKLSVATSENIASQRDLIYSNFRKEAGVTNVSLEIEERFVLPQKFDYFYFPFDHQNVSVDIWLPQTTLLGCSKLVEQLRGNEMGTPLPGRQLLPATGAWLYETCSQVHGFCDSSTISYDILEVPPAPLSTEVGQTCKITLKIRRDNMLELIKNIGPLVVVGYVPVLTLWLNPSIPPLVGGRVSSHIFSMVLVMVKYNTNLGLGILTSMIWIDFFYLCLFCMIALGLFETIFIHSLFRANMALAAMTIDGVFRKLMPMCVYPCIMGAAFLVGLQRNVEAVMLAVGGISLFTVLGVVVSLIRVNRLHSKRRRAINALVRAQLHDDREMDEEDVAAMLHDAMHHAFVTFDLDKSGMLDRKEMRLILKTMYPKMTSQKQLEAMKAVGSDEVSFENFHEAVETWRSIAGERPVETKKPKKNLAGKLVNRDIQSKGLRDLQTKSMICNMLKAETEETNKKKALRAAAGLDSPTKKDKLNDPKFGATSAFASALGKASMPPPPTKAVEWADTKEPVPPKLASAFTKKVVNV